jgi:hypothetical protein
MHDVPLALLIELTIGGLLTLALALVVIGTIRRRGNWGLNMRTVRCPRCGEPAPTVRVPRNWRQTMWGGTTCAQCGLEYDKWGSPVKQPADHGGAGD